ncbi:MAG TPA: fibronectin type III domain-containing protein [Vicinamibacterales bacterium]|nr:fibronectin type III domain-containing protein [Vicinamibacterales bacterium]
MRLFPLPSIVLSVLFALALASPVHADSLTLAWDPPSDTTTVGYIIRYGTEAGKYTVSLDVGLVTTRQIDELTDGTTYFFAVQAYNSNRDRSALSSEVSGLAGGSGGGPEGGPGAGPTSVVASIRDGGVIDIAWLPAPGTPAGYRVEVGTVSGHTVYSAYVADAAITFDIRDLPAAAYFIRVRTFTNGAFTAPSEEVTVAATDLPVAPLPPADGSCVAPPGAPRHLRGSALDTNVHLAWQHGAGPVTTYVLEVGSSPGLRDLMMLALGPGTELRGSAAHGTYAVRLAAVNDCGWSLWGTEMLVVVGTVPGAPASLSQDVTGTLVNLSWSAPTGGAPVTRYLIEAMTASGPFAYDTASPATAFSHMNTPPGSYVVTVRAGNTAGFGPPSAPVTVVVP